MGRIIHDSSVIAHHLVFSGYGQWLSNDLRGSGSTELRQEKFAEFGPIHFGRKWEQPSFADIKTFYRAAELKLSYPPIWFEQRERVAIGDAFGTVIREVGYTVWSCAVMHGHAHLNVRIHRDDARTIWMKFAIAARDAIRSLVNIPYHPVWSSRPYGVYQYNPLDVRRVNKYIFDNPKKEGLSAQIYLWVLPYDGWPWHKRIPPHPKWR